MHWTLDFMKWTLDDKGETIKKIIADINIDWVS